MQTVRKMYNLYRQLLKSKHDVLIITFQWVLKLDQSPYVKNHRSGFSRCCEAVPCNLPQKLALNQGGKTYSPSLSSIQIPKYRYYFFLKLGDSRFESFDLKSSQQYNFCICRFCDNQFKFCRKMLLRKKKKGGISTVLKGCHLLGISSTSSKRPGEVNKQIWENWKRRLCRKGP